jgi:cytochrome P450
VLKTFFLLMALHPKIQRRARQEIDAVLGVGGMATHNDRSSLPYVDAMIKEITRWGPVAPLGMPDPTKLNRGYGVDGLSFLLPGLSHCVTRDDYYDGYLIPKDSRVIGNI